MKAKEYLIALAAFAFAGLAVWKGLQIIASVALILFTMLIYKNQTIILRDFIFGIIKTAKQAKFGEFEIQLADKTITTIDISNYKNLGILHQIQLKSMTSEDLSLLAEIAKNKSYRRTDALKEPMRRLRNLGLVRHNHDSMEHATEVYTTESAQELLRAIGSV